MHIHLVCRYCNNKWEALVNSKEAVEYMSCGICGDGSLEVRDADKVEKIDYYMGCPPFAAKELAIKESSPEPKKPWYWDTQSSSSSTLKNS